MVNWNKTQGGSLIIRRIIEMKSIRFIKLSLLLTIFSLVISCKTSKLTYQDNVTVNSGEFVRDTLYNNYVEYRTGNYPLIITIPHGGVIKVDSLLTRTKQNCPDPKFETVYDSNTPELGNLLDSIIFAQTGKYPHIIFCKLKRTFVDVNRIEEYAIPVGSYGNKMTYKQFYGFIIEAKKRITESYGSGLILDIHAHGHSKQEIEIGYQLTASELNLPDNVLDNIIYANKSGIISLYQSVSSKHSFSQIIRGDNSFGTLLKLNGIECIPHKWNPSPGKTSYFSGGNITKFNGSCSGGTIDAIQLEFNSASRKEPVARKNTAKQLAKTVEQYYELNYKFKKL